MGALHRKLARELWRMKAQVAAIALVMACGIAIFVMSFCVIASLERAQADYYDRYRFADLFTHVKRAPLSLAGPIAALDGVAAVAARVVEDVTLDLPGVAEPAVGRLVSLPDPLSAGLNGLHLRRGRFGEPGRAGEVVANEAFAEAHGFAPGDRVAALLGGRRVELTIVGVALSPEFVYQIRGGDPFPDDRRFGVLWMDGDALATALDMKGACNDFALALERGADAAAVTGELDRLTRRYGGQAAYGREQQVSHRYVSDELRQLRAMAVIAPTLFLVVSAFLLHVVLHRLIATQREEIATLKAFGYARREIALHYLEFTLAIALVGGALGLAGGAWLGRGMAELYARFFRFPSLDFRIDAPSALLALAVAAGAGLAGTLGAVARATALPPAEAMRPEAPACYRSTLAERLGLGALLSNRLRMIVRRIERRPLRALLDGLGIALAVAVFVLGSYTRDVLDHVLDFQFRDAIRYDCTVTFAEPAGRAALHELARLPGVAECEPFRVVPALLSSGPRSRRLALTGLEEERALLTLRDARRGARPLPRDGLLLSETLRGLLGVAPGDIVRVAILEGRQREVELRVADVLDDFSGLAAYMEIRALQRALGEGDAISGAFLRVDPVRAEELDGRLKRTPRVASLAAQRASIASFLDTIAASMRRMRLFTVAFAAILAFGVVYNGARISLSERGHELATLRVLGFTVREATFLLLGEIALLGAVALPLGAWIGDGLSALATAAMQTQTQRFPHVVTARTRVEAIAVVLAAMIFSGWIVRRRLVGLDLVAVLKAKD